MSKFQVDASGSPQTFRFDLVAVFFSCSVLTFFHPYLWGALPVQLSFLVIGWGVGWFWERIGVLLLLIFTMAWGLYIILNWWGTSGPEFWIILSHAVLPIVAMGQVGSSLRRITEQLKLIAGQDPMTGLLSQKRFVELLESRRREHSGPSKRVAILFLDCDQFKAFNDTHGHLLGDQYLIDIAKRISEFLEPHDLAARFGGDEFVILFATADEENIRHRVTALQQSISATTSEGSHQAISWSVGVAIDSLNAGANEIINAADQAMYTAKRLGPGQIHIVTESVSGEE